MFLVHRLSTWHFTDNFQNYLLFSYQIQVQMLFFYVVSVVSSAHTVHTSVCMLRLLFNPLLVRNPPSSSKEATCFVRAVTDLHRCSLVFHSLTAQMSKVERLSYHPDQDQNAGCPCKTLWEPSSTTL